MKKKYTAQVTEDNSEVSYEIDGWGNSAQEFHNTVLCEHIKYPREDILAIYNHKGNKVFNNKRGFSNG